MPKENNNLAHAAQTQEVLSRETHLGATAECVEHVEEDEAGEGHGRVPGGDDVVGDFPHEDPERAGDDDG